MSQIIKDYQNLLLDELKDYFSLMEDDLIHQAADLIFTALQKGNRLHFTGIGKPSYVAKYMASLYSSTNTPAYFLDGTEAVHGSLGQTVPGDVIIAISNSGETAELMNTVQALKKLDLKLISVSSNPQSSLAKASDLHLFAGVEKEGDDLNKPPRLSIISEMVLLQILSLILQDKHQLSKEQYVLFHPGGSIGQDLSK